MIVSAVPVLTYAQQQTNFVSNLSGKNVVPPVSTPATGIAKFHTNSNGTLSYEIDVMNLNKVIAGHIGTKNGTEILQLLNPYATISTGFNQVKSLYPTEVVNGRLASGVITADDLLGPFFWKKCYRSSKCYETWGYLCDHPYSTKSTRRDCRTNSSI